jgi:hypothetical protein
MPTPPRSSPDVRCHLCGAILPGWLPVPNRPHATLLMEHLDRRHHEAFVPLLMRMATEDIGTVAMEAFEGVDHASPRGEFPCA